MFSILLWLGYLFLGCFLSLALATWHLWIALFLIGFAAVFILRLIVLSSTSFASYVRLIPSSLLQPTLCLLPMYYLPYLVGHNIENTHLAYFLISIPVSIFTAFSFIRSVDSVGLTTLKVPTTSVLKAFLANWMEYLNTPLERLFETFGRERDIDFSILAFKVEEKIECLLVVSSFHPGPFRNVGSSFLPFMIKDALEKKINCIAAVPHGLFGHEYDLASQLQNKKVLKSIIDASHFRNTENKATPWVSIMKDTASVSCQKFGNCAILTLTLAPETTEDFPKELGDFIVEEASRCRLDHVVIINAHNSIDGPFNVQTAIKPLKEAIHEVLIGISKLQASTFEMGIAKAVPMEYTLEDGMGPGGISVLVIRVGKQTCAYIIIDGNNMITGLREKILASLQEMHIDAGEVLTTDTHSVNAVVMTRRGYHPIGEAIPHEKLIELVKSTTREALNRLTPASFSWRVGQAQWIKVIGEKQIEELSLLADKALQKAKKRVVPLFTFAGAILIFTLALL